MRTSFGATVFQLFDKVIVAVLAVVALYVVATALTQPSDVSYDPRLVEDYLTKIRDIQKNSKHSETRLSSDYLTGAVGAFRSDLTCVVPKATLFVPKIVEDIVDRTPLRIELDEAGPTAPVTRVYPERFRDAQILIADGEIVKAEWSREAFGHLIITALQVGDTTLELKAGDKSLVQFNVSVVKRADVREEVGPPSNVTAAAIRGQVVVTWTCARTVNARVVKYVILKAEQEKELRPYLELEIPEKIGDEKALPTRRVEDKAPGPQANLDGEKISVADPRVTADTTYEYAVEAYAVGKEGKPLADVPRSGPARVDIAETCRITFRPLTPDAVLINVEVFHIPPADPAKPAVVPEGRWVKHGFVSIERGQQIGWKVPSVYVPEDRLRLKDVDFTTGYQVLDIWNDQRRIATEVEMRDPKGELIGVRQTEERQQKLLIIDGRGRIKVLWPGTGRQE